MEEKNGIFSKIKKFLKNIFSRNEIKKIENNIENLNEEREILLELQKKFREGKLDPEDVTEEQIDKLCKLYDEQIREIKEKLEKYEIEEE